MDNKLVSQIEDKKLSEIFSTGWITGFNINGKDYGGELRSLVGDGRIEALKKLYDFTGKRVLELGPLEGAHTLTLSMMGAKEVVAVEARLENFYKCCLIKDIFNLNKVKFILGDVRDYDFSQLGKFGVVVCSGILYHLTDPLDLIKKLSVYPKVLIWTHVADSIYPVGEEKEVNGYKGKYYTEGNNVQCAGLEAKSFWLYRDELLRMLKEVGLSDITVIQEAELYDIHAKTILLLASK